MLRCEADGSWSSEPPTCKPVACGPPSVQPYSITHFVIAEHGIKYGYGSTATYSCVEGYELQGMEVVVSFIKKQFSCNNLVYNAFCSF